MQTMNEQKAMFLLSAYRPEHQDREDPGFREALELVQKNSGMREWLEEQMAFDRAAAKALREISIPENLRENILAGGSVSGRNRTGWRNWFSIPALRAIAAILVVGFFAVFAVLSRTDTADDWKEAALAAVTDLSEMKVSLDLETKNPEAIREWLVQMEPNLVADYPVPIDQAGAVGCKKVRTDDGLVTILCFEQDGKVFHLASYHEPRVFGLQVARDPVLEKVGKWWSATWSRGEFTHMLIASDKNVKGDGLLEFIEEFSA